MNRRNFFAITAGAAVAGYGIGYFLPKTHADELFLRPPGAVKNFESLCIKCGQCVQVCPYHSIGLLDIAQGYSNGTSYIDAHKRGCYLCDLFPCVLACPSGALDHATTQISDVKMGVGVLREHEACLAYKNENVNLSGVTKMLERKIYNDREQAVKDAVQNSVDKPCDLCVSLCPVGEVAISMAKSDGRNLPEFKRGCVGCGACAEVCPVQIIDIAPNRSYDEIYKG